MNVGPVQPYMIENESDADTYLTALLENPDYRSIDVVRARAAKYCKNEHLKNYFINKAKDVLKI